ncbi:MAG: FtsW/RodA/SpoVE family cell cycle protein [Inquilinaceae bacterium]
MPALARTDTSIMSRWWWTVDRWTLAALGLLIAFGTILIVAASPAVAERLRLSDYHFVNRHLMMLGPALLLLCATSLLSPNGVRRLAMAVMALSLLGLVITVVVGTVANGASRWIFLPGLSLQPSEFAKPAFAVIGGWLFARQRTEEGFPGYALASGLFLMILSLLLLQPDLGMSVIVTAVWGIQFFLAGLPLVLVVGLAALALGGLAGAYFVFDHVGSRIDRFLDPSSGDTYQIALSLRAFRDGGLFGAGPGEGAVKMRLPDAHADFIFAVAGEEFGAIWSLILIALFAFIVLRGFMRLAAETDLFVILATAGLIAQFGMQALINIASTLHLIPTKGMTLPFVSYGGSSLLALALGMGMMLALTRRRAGAGGWS